jgi:dTDP-glucose 4,6-dehydratase
LTPVFVAPRPGEVDRLCCNYEKANKLFGFKPDYTMDMGLDEHLKWYKSHRAEQWQF